MVNLMNEIIIRTENQNDYEQITQVNDLAFNQLNEGKMIEALHKNRKFIPEISLIAEIDSQIPKQVRNDFIKKCKVQKRELKNTAVMHL